MKEETKLDRLLKELEEMDKRKAVFSEYYQKMIEGIKEIEGNDIHLFTYSLLQSVRCLGDYEGSKCVKNQLITFINNS